MSNHAAADALTHAPVGEDGAMTGRVNLAGPALWLIEIAGCEIHLVGSERELRDLLRRRPVTGETQVYEVGAAPRALRNVPELARVLPQVSDAEPPIRLHRPRLETRSPERVKLSEELAILDRPLEDDIEYDDEAPRSRAKPVLAAMLLVAALAGTGYRLLAQRDRSDDGAAARSMQHERAQASPLGARRASDSGPQPEPDGDPPTASPAVPTGAQPSPP